jgi:hypothetical protein
VSVQQAADGRRGLIQRVHAVDAAGVTLPASMSSRSAAKSLAFSEATSATSTNSGST